ncbi:lamin tail domain-containing protein [Candidatus Peregrinibacteria bacterium]|nr:lamin tail domain-containing protein [Candidatus Peregrinibacteria bacterium]
MKHRLQHIFSYGIIAIFAINTSTSLLFADEKNTMIINEIAAYEKREYEWIEIFNRSDAPVDMEGWKFFENKTRHDLTTVQGTSTIQAGNFAVIAEDAEKFLEKYPEFKKTLFDSSWSGLKEAGEEIGLLDEKGEIRELFTYISAPDTSLERKNAWLDDFSGENWAPHADSATPGAQNTTFPEISTANETKTALIKNSESTKNTEPIQNEPEHTESRSKPPPSEPDTYEPDTTEQESAQNAPDNTDDLKNIIISEFVPNPAGSDTSEEWIELANTSDRTIALQRLFLDDEEGGSKPFSLEKYAIAPFGFLVIKSRESKLSLKNSGDSVRLLLDNEKILEEIVYDDSALEDESFARDEEGTFSWSQTTTPGAENIIAEKSDTPINGNLSKNIFFSEIFPNPKGSDASDEWIELENTGESDVNLGNWKIEEKGGKTHALSHELVVPAYGWLTLYRTESGVSLNNSSEELSLFNFESTLIDSIEYEKAPEEQSFTKIRIKDHDNFWEWTEETTEGDENPSYEILSGTIEKMSDPTANGGLKSFLLKTAKGMLEIEYEAADLGNQLPETLFIPESEIEVIGKQLKQNQYELKRFTIIQRGNPVPEKKAGANSALPAALFGVPIAAFTMLNFFPLEKIKSLLAGMRK